jgi:amino acid transporter
MTTTTATIIISIALFYFSMSILTGYLWGKIPHSSSLSSIIEIEDENFARAVTMIFWFIGFPAVIYHLSRLANEQREVMRALKMAQIKLETAKIEEELKNYNLL